MDFSFIQNGFLGRAGPRAACPGQRRAKGCTPWREPGLRGHALARASPVPIRAALGALLLCNPGLPCAENAPSKSREVLEKASPLLELLDTSSKVEIIFDVSA